ncbi:MAG: copper amine oxidase N-terminal domain-containing protein [Akkermansiaceae bacterium]|nr:copper amine oxidase N-terminal domain-containing protein [Armatimonadota bacterium]
MITHKRTVFAAALAALSFTLPARAQSPVAVTVNGDPVSFPGQPPVQQSDRILVPLRGVLEKIGATVRYSGPTKTIRATKGETKIELTLGERAANISGKAVSLDVPAQAINGTTLVPLRFVAESLGADVKFDGTARVVAIRTDGKPNVIVVPERPSVGAKPTGPSKPSTFTGIFVDFAGQNDASYTLKMTDGKTLVLLKGAELLYNGRAIGFDDLRSGDKVVATMNKSGNGIRAVISDDEG